MTTPEENAPPTLASLAARQQDMLQAIESLAQGQIDGVKNMEIVTNTLGIITHFVDEQRDLNNKVFDFMGDANRKLDGIRTDLGEVRGGHARSAVLRNAALVADALDCRLISEVPQGVLLGFAKVAQDDGEDPGDVESFRNADMVLYVSNTQGRPLYIAVEASFTVADGDVTRAVRNAAYLQKYTGLPALAVVAGVEVLDGVQDRIDREEVHLYRIQRRELQPQ